MQSTAIHPKMRLAHVLNDDASPESTATHPAISITLPAHNASLHQPSPPPVALPLAPADSVPRPHHPTIPRLPTATVSPPPYPPLSLSLYTAQPLRARLGLYTPWGSGVGGGVGGGVVIPRTTGNGAGCRKLRRDTMCQSCGKSFKTKQGLSRHYVTVHLKQRPFKCVDCHATFGQKCSLQRHRRSVHHKEDNAFACEHASCALVFTRYAALQSHIKAYHNGAYPFRCRRPGCAKTFMWASSYRSHEQTVHGGVSSNDKVKIERM